jgi:hypothetical protein
MHQTPVQWAGLHHLALITDDMDTTTRLWHGGCGSTSPRKSRCTKVSASMTPPQPSARKPSHKPKQEAGLFAVHCLWVLRVAVVSGRNLAHNIP